MELLGISLLYLTVIVVYNHGLDRSYFLMELSENFGISVYHVWTRWIIKCKSSCRQRKKDQNVNLQVFISQNKNRRNEKNLSPIQVVSECSNKSA